MPAKSLPYPGYSIYFIPKRTSLRSMSSAVDLESPFATARLEVF